VGAIPLIQWTASLGGPGNTFTVPSLYFDANNNSRVFVAGTNGVSAMYNGATGVQIWNRTVSGAVYDRGLVKPIGGTNVVFFTSADGYVNALRVTDNSGFWPGGRSSIGTSVRAGVGYEPGLGPSGKGLIFAGTHNTSSPTNRLVALDALTGQQAWQYSGTGGRLGAFAAAPVVDALRHRIYSSICITGTGEDSLVALDTTTGLRLWGRSDLGAAGNEAPLLSADGTTLYVALNNGLTLYALDAATGALKAGWTPFTPGGQIRGHSFYDDITIWDVLVSTGNAVYALDATTGAPRSGWPAGGVAVPGAGAPLVLADSHQAVYVGGNNGIVYKLALSNGQILGILNLNTGAAVSQPTYDPRRNAFYATSANRLFSIDGGW
jgi:outer membrane protein assembly factor BamB